MKFLIGCSGEKYATLVESSQYIYENIYDFIEMYIDSSQYSRRWGVEELVRFIKKTKNNTDDFINIIELYTDQYEKTLPRINI